MPYNEKLANRIRARLSGLKRVEEKPMMGGLAFMTTADLHRSKWDNRV